VDEQLHRATVVVGIDGSEQALRAVRWGASEAERSRTPLRLVTAFGLLAGDPHGGLHTEERYRRAMLARAQRYLAEAAVVAAQQERRIEVEQQVLTGHPVSVLGHESRHARVVVIGDRGLGRIEGLLVGSVAVGLAVHAHCPVVVVRGEQPDLGAGPVVVGMAGVASDEAALAFAFDAAAARHVPLVAVHAWSDPMADPMTRSAPDLLAIESIERGRLADRLAGWMLKYPEVAVEQVVADGAAAPVLLDRAARAQLLVVGSRGRGEFAGMLLGSVSHAVLHRAVCPVAVARSDGESGGHVR
jgi:nucleotide-binding universal stress UspA family protein